MLVNLKTTTWKTDDYEKGLKKEQRRKKLKKTLRKGKLMTMVFYYSGKKAMVESSTLALGTAIGLAQGFKYGGNWKRGVVSGAATLITIGVITGVDTLVRGMEQINKTISREE